MPEDFLTVFNFEVHVTASNFGGDEGLADDAMGAFSEVTGLETTIETTDLREGGYNRGTRRLVGKTSNPTLGLKRGMSLDAAFWTWIQRCMDGTYPLPYVDGSVHVFPAGVDRDAATPAVWSFTNGIVTRVKAADLNAVSASSVPIEELDIAHEGLERIVR